MKKISIYALSLALGAMALTSCEDAFGGFLDKQPSNELTKDQYKETIHQRRSVGRLGFVSAIS